jgi:hypothetical protein
MPIALLALVLLLAPAAPAAASPAVDALNAQREAHGIPAGIVESPAWSDGCAKHAAYMALHGLTHEEDPELPGYTIEGAHAGVSSVLHVGGGWWEGGVNPWEDAPIHLMQLLAPELSVSGAARGCMYTWPGYLRPLPEPAGATVYSYPGDGATGVPPRQIARERPFVPGDFVGLPEGTATGPHLYVLPFGAGRGRLTSATLTGPQGPVDVRTVDNGTAGGELGMYLPPGGIVIPVAPLQPGAAYTASATFAGARGEYDPDTGDDEEEIPVIVSRTWSFTTAAEAAGDAPRARTPKRRFALAGAPRFQRERGVLRRGLRLRVTAPRAGGYRVTVRTRRRALGRYRVTALRAGRSVVRVKLSRRAKAALVASRRAATLTVTARSGAGCSVVVR